jgi:hypothetical protein
MVALKLFDSETHGLHCGGCYCFQKSVGHSLLNRWTTDVEAVHAATLD